MLQARLDMLVAALSASIWFNPCLTLIWMLPFLGLFPDADQHGDDSGEVRGGRDRHQAVGADGRVPGWPGLG